MHIGKRSHDIFYQLSNRWVKLVNEGEQDNEKFGRNRSLYIAAKVGMLEGMVSYGED